MLIKIFRKIRDVKGRPFLLKKTIMDYLITLISKAYDQIILFVDRLISLFCIPIYDLCCAFRKKDYQFSGCATLCL